MAKTASQIAAERKLIEASRNAIHQRQMAGVGERNAARTAAVYTKAAAATKDPVKKEYYLTAAKGNSKSAADMQKKKEDRAEKAKKNTGKTTALDMQKKKEDRAEAKTKKDAMYSRKATAEKALQDYLDSEEQQKKNADMAARAMVYGVADEGGEYTPDETLRQLQDEARRAGAAVTAYENARTAERNARIAELDSVENWSDEDKAALEQYINDKQSAFVQSLNPAMTGLPADYESNPLIAKYGRARLDQIASSYQRMKNQQEYEAAQQTGRESADKGAIAAIGANAASIGANLADTLLNPLERIAQGAVGRDDRYSTLDPYAGGQAGAYAAGVRQKTAENIAGDEYDEQGNLIKEGGTGRQIGSYIYQGGMSALDSAARALVAGSPTAGASLAALGSFNQTLREASEKGATAGEAVALATVNSAIEAATEKLPLDELFKVAKGGAKPAAKFVMNILKQAGIEILEEEASLIGTTLAEAAILREKSGYNQQIAEAMANGATEEQAKKQALQSFLAEALNIAITSGISGGFGGAGAGITGAVNSKLNDTRAARQQQTQTEASVQEAQQIQRTAAPKDSTPTADMQMDASNQSAESGQIKGTGAAEFNFSEKPAYNATLSADNAQPDRRTDVRPMELPRQDVNGGNISAVTGNVYGSQNTPDDLASAMEEPTARGDFSYIPISNDEATQRAQKTIEDAGSWATAEQNFHDDVRDGKAGAEISARGALILNHAAEVYQQAKQTGNPEATKEAQTKWLSILSDLRQLGTNTAQGLQAMRIIRNLMPEDKLEFAKTAVRNMVRDMKLKTPIQIDENLLTEYENATTDEQRDEVIGKIQKNVAEQIPSTLLDKWNALRYTNMLGNLKTQDRNFAGNVGSTIAYRVKDATGAAIESLANWVSGGKVGRTKSVIVSIPLQKACGAYYQKVKTDISSGGKFSENRAAQDDFTQGVMDERRIFKSNAKNETVRKVVDFAWAPMEAYRKGTNWMMNNKYFGDEAFGKAAFTHAMAGYLQANGVKTEADMQKADPALIDKAMAYAVKEAQETTFHDNSALARVLGRLKKDMGVVGEGIFPFTKTPANVLTRAEEFSPLGLINTAVLSAQKAAGNTKLTEANGRLGSWAERGQDITGTDIINSLSKSLTGTMIFALGAVMKSQGMISAGADEDEEKAAFDKEVGKQEYAIVMPDGTSYTFDWATPEALPLFMGAQFMELMQEADDGITFADLEKVFTSIADPMIQMSMLQGINDSLDSIKYADSNLIEFVLNASLNYLTQGLTNTLLGQIEKSTEETRQTTYVDKDSEIPAWMQRTFGKASQKIPGWDFQQTDYINARGETEQQRTDGVGWLYNLTSPGYLKKADVGEVEQELYRLHDATDENVFPESPSTTLTWTDKTGTVHKDQNLTAEQAETLKKTYGQTYMRLAGDIMKSKDYDAMSEEQAAKALQQADTYARKKAEIAAIGEDHTGYDEAWMMEMEAGAGADYIIRRVTKSEISSAMDALDTAWDKGYDTTGRSDDLKWAYDTFSQMSDGAKADAREWLTGTAAKYVEAREKGVSHDAFVAIAKTINDLPLEPTYTEVRDIQKREAIANNRSITEIEKDIIMKAYMPDYNPSAKSPQTTELKYDAIRDLGVSPKGYTDAYRDYLDASGSGKRKRTIKQYVKYYGWSKSLATKVYDIYAGYSKPWE